MGNSFIQDFFDTSHISASENGFVWAVFHAYSHHHNLILRPKDVWFAILSQLSDWEVSWGVLQLAKTGHMASIEIAGGTASCRGDRWKEQACWQALPFLPQWYNSTNVTTQKSRGPVKNKLQTNHTIHIIS